MFTGIIEEIGKVRHHNGSNLSVESHRVAKHIIRGGSMSLNGVCLTMVKKSGSVIDFEIMPETYSKTNFRTFSSGSSVNLESPLTLAKPLGGHIVLGHIDGTGKITKRKIVGNSIELTVRTKKELSRYIVQKGFIAIDGVSLTVVSIAGHHFNIALIPKTQKKTNLGKLKVNEYVNIEVDIFAKYIEKLCQK